MNVPQEVVDVVTAATQEAAQAVPKPSPPRAKPVRPQPTEHDPDRFLTTAKSVVVENYNLHRDSSRSPELTMSGVYIVWFAKTLGNWKAIVASPVVRGLLWEVTFNGHRGEVYLDVYKKMNNVKISLEVAGP